MEYEKYRSKRGSAEAVGSIEERRTPMEPDYQEWIVANYDPSRNETVSYRVYKREGTYHPFPVLVGMPDLPASVQTKATILWPRIVKFFTHGQTPDDRKEIAAFREGTLDTLDVGLFSLQVTDTVPKRRITSAQVASFARNYPKAMLAMLRSAGLPVASFEYVPARTKGFPYASILLKRGEPTAPEFMPVSPASDIAVGTRITPLNIHKLSVGTKLRVPGRKTPVEVMHREVIDGRTYVTTSSGKVRPGRVGGGLLTAKADSDTVADMHWQPTLRQQAVYGPEVEVVALPSAAASESKPAPKAERSAKPVTLVAAQSGEYSLIATYASRLGVLASQYDLPAALTADLQRPPSTVTEPALLRDGDVAYYRGMGSGLQIVFHDESFDVFVGRPPKAAFTGTYTQLRDDLQGTTEATLRALSEATRPAAPKIEFDDVEDGRYALPESAIAVFVDALNAAVTASQWSDATERTATFRQPSGTAESPHDFDAEAVFKWTDGFVSLDVSASTETAANSLEWSVEAPGEGASSERGKIKMTSDKVVKQAAEEAAKAIDAFFERYAAMMQTYEEDEPEPEDPVFGRVISRYTRAQAIEDGALIDIDALDPSARREAGIKFPIAVTPRVYAEVLKVHPRAERLGQDLRGRVWDLVNMLRFGVKTATTDGPELVFKMRAVLPKGRGGASPIKLRAVVGPGDDMEPVFTIAFADEAM